jgi:hypothetical protein
MVVKSHLVLAIHEEGSTSIIDQHHLHLEVVKLLGLQVRSLTKLPRSTQKVRFVHEAVELGVNDVRYSSANSMILY